MPMMTSTTMDSVKVKPDGLRGFLFIKKIIGIFEQGVKRIRDCKVQQIFYRLTAVCQQ